MSRSTGPDAVFQALSDPTRREVMRRLSQDGPTTLGELASGLPVTRQAVSKHLLVLDQSCNFTTEGQRMFAPGEPIDGLPVPAVP